MLSTPQGKGYFWECFRRGQDPLEPDWQSWQMHTECNPMIPQSELDAARQSMTERQYRQEFCAEFGEDENSVFSNVENCIGSEELNQPDESRVYTAGIVLARLHDFTVITVFDDLGNQRYLLRFRHKSWHRTIKCIAEICNRFKAAAIVDATGIGDPIIELIQMSEISVLPVKFTQPKKEALIQALALKFEQNRIKLLDNSTQTNELLNYSAYRNKLGTLSYTAPSGQHDDCVIAVALATSRFDSSPFEVHTSIYNI